MLLVVYICFVDPNVHQSSNMQCLHKAQLFWQNEILDKCTKMASCLFFLIKMKKYSFSACWRAETIQGRKPCSSSQGKPRLCRTFPHFYWTMDQIWSGSSSSNMLMHKKTKPWKALQGLESKQSAGCIQAKTERLLCPWKTEFKWNSVSLHRWGCPKKWIGVGLPSCLRAKCYPWRVWWL